MKATKPVPIYRPIPKTPRFVSKNLKKLMGEVCELDGYECRNPFCESWRMDSGKHGVLKKLSAVVLDPPHHIVFKSQGGDDTAENLVLLCKVCHRFMHHGRDDLHMDRMTGRKCAILMLDVLKLRANFRHKKPLSVLFLKSG